MRVGILYTAALRQRGGIGRLTRGLVETLMQVDQQNQYTLLITRDAPLERLPQLPPNFRVRTIPITERWLTRLWHRLDVPLAADWWTGSLDLFHAPDFVLPPLHRAPGLLTVHDFSFMRHPNGAVPRLREWLNRVVPKSVHRAHHILADSESTRRDIIEILHAPPEKVTVVGAGVETRFHPIKEPEQHQLVREKYQLPSQFVLGLGTLEPRKNFTGLIEAFNQVAADLPQLHLVIAGGKGWLYEDIFKAAANSPSSERIHLIGFVDDADLPTLYSMAHLFAYPSHYEGFGIPVLEAMACGTPVVTANNSSLPEVAGDAALMVPSTNSDMLANVIHRLSTDITLRSQCKRRGLVQAKHFTWHQAAKKLLQVYQAFDPLTKAG